MPSWPVLDLASSIFPTRTCLRATVTTTPLSPSLGFLDGDWHPVVEIAMPGRFVHNLGATILFH
ncbi:MAG: hypothetical protein V4447_07605 [Pseudomonadota bacterium]